VAGAYVAVVGPGDASARQAEAAEQVGRGLAQAGSAAGSAA
jgi:hypothetical protein